MINAEIEEEKKANSYSIPSNVTENLIESSFSNLNLNSLKGSTLKSSNSTPTFSSLIEKKNNLISKSMNMATVTSTATLLPNFFNLNDNLNDNLLESTNEMKNKNKKIKKKIDSFSACFKGRSTSISGLEVNENEDEHKKQQNSIKNNLTVFNKLPALNNRQLKQTLSLDHDLLNYNDHIDLASSQVQNLLIENEQHVNEIREEKKLKEITETRHTIELNKKEENLKKNEKERKIRSINEIQIHNRINSQINNTENIQLNTANQLSTAISTVNNQLSTATNQSSTAVNTAKTVNKKEEKVKNIINKSADLVNHLVSCASKERINEDKLNLHFSFQSTIDNLKTTNKNSTSKKINLKIKKKSKSINNLGDCSSNQLNVTNDLKIKQSTLRSHSHNSFNQLNDSNLNNKTKKEFNQLEEKQQLLTTVKLNQKGGALCKLKKFAKGFNSSSNSKNRIRESLCSQSKNCIEQLLLHENCKTNNKCTSPLTGIKNEFKMRFRRSDLDKEYNLTKSMKSVDYKDLTLMQILALKPIRHKIKFSNQEKFQQQQNLKVTSQEKNIKMVLPELIQTSPICGETPQTDCFELFTKNDHQSFTSKLIKNDESFNCENIQSNKQIINNKLDQFIDKCKTIKCDSEIIYNNKPNKWIQLSGHEQSFFNSNKPGIILKKNEQNESTAYKLLNEMNDKIIDFMPKFYSVISSDEGYQFIELQDLLTQFDNPCIMDLKMGSRTFLETDVSNMRARPDLYEKLIKIDQNAATEEEHKLKAITKLRYMTFRENLSSSSTLGFRIEGFRCKCNGMIKDFKYLRKEDEVKRVLKAALPLNKDLKLQLLKRLKLLRSRFKESDFFKNHEIVGSSLLIVYDDYKINVWIIDLAKCVELPNGIKINHEKSWFLGNHEDGYLTGLNNLISIIKEIV